MTNALTQWISRADQTLRGVNRFHRKLDQTLRAAAESGKPVVWDSRMIKGLLHNKPPKRYSATNLPESQALLEQLMSKTEAHETHDAHSLNELVEEYCKQGKAGETMNAYIENTRGKAAPGLIRSINKQAPEMLEHLLEETFRSGYLNAQKNPLASPLLNSIISIVTGEKASLSTSELDAKLAQIEHKPRYNSMVGVALGHVNEAFDRKDFARDGGIEDYQHLWHSVNSEKVLATAVTLDFMRDAARSELNSSVDPLYVKYLLNLKQFLERGPDAFRLPEE